MIVAQLDVGRSIGDGISTLASYIPQLIGAIIILVVGYVIARLVEALVVRILRGLGFERAMEGGGIKQFFDRAQTEQTPLSILGKVVFWFIFIIAITMAANALGIQQISGFLNQLIAYIPSIFAAILILLLAGLLANFLSGIVRGATGSGVLASITQYAIIVYAVFAALTELGIAVQITAPTFLIVLGAVALAAAIAFGIGGREVAREIIEKAYNRREEVTDSTAGEQRPDAYGSGRGERPEARPLRREEP